MHSKDGATSDGTSKDGVSNDGAVMAPSTMKPPWNLHQWCHSSDDSTNNGTMVTYDGASYYGTALAPPTMVLAATMVPLLLQWSPVVVPPTMAHIMIAPPMIA